MPATMRGAIRAAAFALAALIGTGSVPPARAQAEPFVGQLMLVGFNFCPRGWAAADGQLLPINQHQALFSLLGTIYGGDGRTTFALPDLRGRTPLHAGQGPGLAGYAMGQRGGAETVTLSEAQAAAHSHAATTTATLHATAAKARTSTPAGNILANTNPNSAYRSAGSTTAMREDSIAAQTTVAASGSGEAHENRPPYLVARWCIALQGIYPSRS